MPHYKLTYFNVTALAEPIRWIFKYAKIPFEEERIDFDDWPNHKSRFPLGQLPIVEEDGKLLNESSAIGRYLAKKYGLLSGDDWLDYCADQVVEIVTDLRIQWLVFFWQNGEEREASKQNLLLNVCPKILTQISKIVEANEGGPFIAGEKVTYGDFWLANWVQIWQKTLSETILDEYPILTKHLESVLAIQQIKQWVEDRPKTII